MAVKTCAVCSKIFSNSRSNAVYCSSVCRQKARNKRRSHKDNEKTKRPSKIVDNPKNNILPYSGMKPLEYWRKYKEELLESEREFNFKGFHLVGGIDIHEENFEYLVVELLVGLKIVDEVANLPD